jgi:hypothetical protein
MASLEPAVTWIKVEKPVFDLVGVVLGSFRLTGALLVLTVVFGIAAGAALIRARRRRAAVPLEDVSLHLDPADPAPGR